MTSLQIEANKLIESQRHNKVDEGIGQHQADSKRMSAITEQGRYQLDKEMLPFKQWESASKTWANTMQPITGKGGLKSLFIPVK